MRQQAAGILFLFCWQTALVRQRAAAEAETRQRAGPVSCRLMQRGAFSSGRISNQILLAVGQKHNEILVCARSMVGLPRAGEGDHPFLRVPLPLRSSLRLSRESRVPAPPPRTRPLQAPPLLLALTHPLAPPPNLGAGEAVGEHQTDVHPLLNEGILWHPWRPAESGRV